MRIGILGSYFNPPHLGHTLIAQQCLDFAGFDKIWLLPGLHSTFNKELIDITHRLSMTKLIQLPQTEVSTLEIDHKLDGNTINLVPILKKKYSKDTFTFVIGSDQLPTFHKWGSWRELLGKLPFLVVPRAGYPLEPLYAGMKLFTHPLFAMTNISSSLVRERVKQGLSIDTFVTKEVRKYIERQGLYT